MAKTADLELLDYPKLISRKIWITEKSWSFHTVKLNISWNCYFFPKKNLFLFQPIWKIWEIWYWNLLDSLQIIFQWFKIQILEGTIFNSNSDNKSSDGDSFIQLITKTQCGNLRILLSLRFYLENISKLISRKIWLTEKSSNFHTVQCTKEVTYYWA